MELTTDNAFFDPVLDTTDLATLLRADLVVDLGPVPIAASIVSLNLWIEAFESLDYLSPSISFWDVTPSLRTDDFAEVLERCDLVSFFLA